jgi:hypothetical protein
MAYGDIDIQSLQIGSLNLSSPSGGLNVTTMDIFEDILDPFGPTGEIKVLDAVDALGQVNLNGKEEAQITFGVPGAFSNSRNFKFKINQNSDLDDGSQNNYGGTHYKTYTLKLVRPETISAQGNYVKKSYNSLTSDIVKDIVKNNFKSDLEVEVKDSTRGQRRFVFNQEHPVEALKKINNEHVSTQNESSLYTLYMTDDGGQQKYVLSTFEELFKQAPVAKLAQNSALGAGASDYDKQNSILWFKASDSFFTASRPLDKANEQTYNLTTGKAHNVPPQQSSNYGRADPGNGVYDNYQGSGDEKVPRTTTHDPSNNKNKPTFLASAKAKKAIYLSHLAQNAAELEIPGNSNIKLGSMIEVDIPNKSDPTTGSMGEKQMNGKGLVVAIRHKVKPVGQAPRYTMLLRIVKASYKESGGGNG